jgi:hypothetical protein
MTSLTSLLFGTRDAKPVLQQRLGPLLLELPLASLAMDMRTEIATALDDLLDMPVGQLALDGWAKRQRVHAACERTRRQPRRREVVPLAEHTLTVTQHPTIELTVGGTTHRLLTLALEVQIEVTAVTLVIQHGRVAEVRHGAASAEATLSAGKVRLAHGVLDGIELRPIRRPPSWGHGEDRRAS